MPIPSATSACQPQSATQLHQPDCRHTVLHPHLQKHSNVCHFSLAFCLMQESGEELVQNPLHIA